MSSEQLWPAIAEQVPALVVLVFVVLVFLKHIKESQDREEAAQARREEVLETIGEKVSATVERNTTALAKNSYILDKAIKLFEGK